MAKVSIDWAQVDAMLLDMLSGNQIAARLKISARTLQDRCKKEKGVKWDEYKDRMRISTIQRISNALIKAAVGYSFEVSKTVESYRTGPAGQKIVTKSTTETKKVFVPPDAKVLVHVAQQYLGHKPVVADRVSDPNNPKTSGYIIEDESGKVIEGMPEFNNEASDNDAENDA